LFCGAFFFGFSLGRPAGADVRKKRHWYPRGPYIAVLAVSLAVCGFVFGKSPNPMEGIVKLFKAMVGLYPSVLDKALLFGLFLVLALVGNKLVCGWACPFGAAQELIYSLPLLKRFKRKKLPFAVTNSIRAAIFVLALLILFGLVGNSRGMVIYHYVNPFNLFNFDFDPITILVMVVVALVLSLGVYRSFCQFVCPFGFVSWIFERLSPARVKIDRERCTKCESCVRACPLEAARGRVYEKKLQADCFSCMRCLNACSFDAICYRNPFTGKKEDG
jgi:polyferredoxin